jgi:hypothetical protein
MFKPVRYLVIILLATNFFACKNNFENYSNNPQDLLSFSADTVSFDTVLTTVYSPYLYFSIYNKNSKPLLISSIQLAGGENSDFKINVDGMAGTSFQNVEILANDSLFVLVNIKPKENGQYTPTLSNDYIIFETHNVQQKVVLQASGQDVYSWRGAIISTDSVLDNRKPYLIYDSLVIDKGATVEIGEGSVFYMSNNAQFIVKGTVKIKGAVENPVVFRGSRTDYMVTIPYDLIPGQWGGIRFEPDSYGNELENVRIRNGSYGMDLQVCGDPSRSKLYMKNVVLTNVSGTLLQAVNCNIVAENCEFTNAKNALLYLAGGSCRFTHCTIANYYPYNPQAGWANSKHETLVLTDTWRPDTTTASQSYPVISAQFFNTVIWGLDYSSTSGISIDHQPGDSIPYLFQNCLLPNAGTNDNQLIDCLFQADPLFRKTDPNDIENNRWYPSFDFRLKENSPVKDVANLEIATQIPCDLTGFYRLTDGKPDIGAYEYHDTQ